MDPDGDYKIRHSIRSTASDDDNPTSIDDLTSPSKIFAPGSDVRLPGKSPKGGDAYKGPTAPPMEEDSPLPTAPTATDAAASSMDPRGNAYADMMRDTKMMGLEPPVSNSVAVPIGFDSDVMALPEAKALPIVGSTANEGTKMPPATLEEEVDINDTEAQIDEEEPTLVPVPFSSNEDGSSTNHDATSARDPDEQSGQHTKVPSPKRCTCKRKLCFVALAFVAILGTVLGVLFGTSKGQMLLKGYPKCNGNPEWIANGLCDERVNTAECGYDGGDCELYNSLPDCNVDYPSWIGNGGCNGRGSYNTAECGWDGGDCVIDGYPDCHVEYPSWIGNDDCDHGDYNTAECGWDGGDCVIDGYPDCHVDWPEDIGDGWCQGGFNTAECGWDGGDCVEFNEQYPDCHVRIPGWIGDGDCDGGDYDTAECGWDGGDCLFRCYWDKACTGTIGSIWTDTTRSGCQQKCMEEGDGCKAFDFNRGEHHCRLFSSYSWTTTNSNRKCWKKK